MRAPYDDGLVGSRLSHYHLDAPIGSGATGTVYRARDERLQRDVAVKVLCGGFSGGDWPRTLVDEARILSRLNHPNIAAVYDVDRARGRDFLVLELVPGLTLEELLVCGPLSSFEVVRLGAQMARGLAAAHAAGIIHRDIKPANIKITPEGELKLLDFGVAELVRDQRTTTPGTTQIRQGGPLGTVAFMSPEQLRGDPVDERSDIFSAGAVLYQMVTARPAFPQRQLACLIDAVLNLDPVCPRVINVSLTTALEVVVLKALRKNRDRRYQSATALGAALEEATNDGNRITRRLTSYARRWWSAVRRAGRVPAGAQILRT